MTAAGAADGGLKVGINLAATEGVLRRVEAKAAAKGSRQHRLRMCPQGRDARRARPASAKRLPQFEQ